MEVELIASGDFVLTMDGDAGPIKDGAVAVQGGRVEAVGPRDEILAKYFSLRHLGGPGRAVMPGLVNAHTHSPMSLLRGIADDLPLKDWLEGHIWPAEERWLSEEFVRDASELACLEMLKAGTTACSDMYFYQGVTADVVKGLGMRAVVGAGVIDFPTKTTKGPEDCLRKAESFIARWKGDPLVTPSIALHAPYTCGPETIRRAMDIALREGVLCQIHLSETAWEVGEITARYGKPPAFHLDALGALNGSLLASHCVWLSEDEIGLMAKRGANVVHCIESNLKLASGIAPVPRMLKAGIHVALGTDGAASNNDLSVLGEAATAAKVHKAAAGDATVLDAKTALMMATRWGAQAIGLPEAGYLGKGALADFIVLDLMKPHLVPLYNIYSQIVYSMMPSDIESVVVGGRVIVEGGRLLSADEREIILKAQHWGRKIAASGI